MKVGVRKCECSCQAFSFHPLMRINAVVTLKGNVLHGGWAVRDSKRIYCPRFWKFWAFRGLLTSFCDTVQKMKPDFVASWLASYYGNNFWQHQKEVNRGLYAGSDLSSSHRCQTTFPVNSFFETHCTNSQAGSTNSSATLPSTTHSSRPAVSLEAFGCYRCSVACTDI